MIAWDRSCSIDDASKADGFVDARITPPVYASHMQWDPKGDQESMFGSAPPGAANPDILLAKLRPGQELAIELHAVKGVGRDHAKFSPVATASYRLLPHIDIAAEGIPKEHRAKFIKCFPEGVIGLRKRKSDGEEEVYVKNPRKDTVSREVLRHKEFEDRVKLGRVRDHFLCEFETDPAPRSILWSPSLTPFTLSSALRYLSSCHNSRHRVDRSLRTRASPTSSDSLSDLKSGHGPQVTRQPGSGSRHRLVEVVLYEAGRTIRDEWWHSARAAAL